MTYLIRKECCESMKSNQKSNLYKVDCIRALSSFWTEYTTELKKKREENEEPVVAERNQFSLPEYRNSLTKYKTWNCIYLVILGYSL